LKVSPKTSSAVKSWLAERQGPNSRTNSFSSSFTIEDFSTFLNSGKKLAAFFSSSRDELEGLGSDWSTFEWRDQYDAFLALGKVLAARDYQLVLRVHPNLQNKTPDDIKFELERIQELRRAGFCVIAPNSNVSSYSLVKSSDLVIVARSTIGIEAMTAAKPVILTANSFYDQLPGVLLVQSQNNIDNLPEIFHASTDLENSALHWLEFNYERDFPYKNVDLHIRPALLRRVRGLLNLDVLTYYCAEILVRIFTLNARLAIRRHLAQYERAAMDN
jgi:hypothetical protein